MFTHYPQSYGARRWRTATITAADSPYSLPAGVDVLLADYSAGSIVVNLPTVAAAGYQRRVTVQQVGATNPARDVAVNRAGADTIDGAVSVGLYLQYDIVTLRALVSGRWGIVQNVGAARFLSGADRVFLPAGMVLGGTQGSESVVGSFTGMALGSRTIAFADSPYSALDTDCMLLVNAAGGNVAITLPVPGIRGRVVAVAKIDASANTVTVTPAGGKTINGAGSLVLTAQYQARGLQYAGHPTDPAQCNWYITG